MQAESARLYRQIGKDISNEHAKKLQETVDKVRIYNNISNDWINNDLLMLMQ